MEVDFGNGAIGQLDLTIKIRGDWHEGFRVYGEGGSVFATTDNPLFYKSSLVRCYREDQQIYQQPLGADGFSYRRQLEHFARVIRGEELPKSTGLNEGIEVIKGLIAIQKSIIEQKTVYLDDIKQGRI